MGVNPMNMTDGFRLLRTDGFRKPGTRPGNKGMSATASNWRTMSAQQKRNHELLHPDFTFMKGVRASLSMPPAYSMRPKHNFGWLTKTPSKYALPKPKNPTYRNRRTHPRNWTRAQVQHFLRDFCERKDLPLDYLAVAETMAFLTDPQTGAFKNEKEGARWAMEGKHLMKLKRNDVIDLLCNGDRPVGNDLYEEVRTHIQCFIGTSKYEDMEHCYLATSDFKPAFSMGKIFDAVVGKTETPGPSYYTVPPAIGCHPTNHFGPHPMIHSSFRFKFPTARRYDPSCERPGPGPGAYDLIDERKRPDIPWTAKYTMRGRGDGQF